MAKSTMGYPSKKLSPSAGKAKLDKIGKPGPNLTYLPTRATKKQPSYKKKY